MNTESIRQLATDINNVAAASFQSGKEHIERPLLAKIERLQDENKELRGVCEPLLKAYCYMTQMLQNDGQFMDDQLTQRAKQVLKGSDNE